MYPSIERVPTLDLDRPTQTSFRAPQITAANHLHGTITITTITQTMGLTKSGGSCAKRMLCLVPLLAASTAIAAPVTEDPTDPTQLANSTTSIAVTHNFTAVPGYLTGGNDVAPRQNVTLASAELICGALDTCIGITFNSPTSTPGGVVQDVYFKGVNSHCGLSRFADGICVNVDRTWQVRGCHLKKKRGADARPACVLPCAGPCRCVPDLFLTYP